MYSPELQFLVSGVYALWPNIFFKSVCTSGTFYFCGPKFIGWIIKIEQYISLFVWLLCVWRPNCCLFPNPHPLSESSIALDGLTLTGQPWMTLSFGSSRVLGLQRVPPCLVCTSFFPFLTFFSLLKLRDYFLRVWRKTSGQTSCQSWQRPGGGGSLGERRKVNAFGVRVQESRRIHHRRSASSCIVGGKILPTEKKWECLERGKCCLGFKTVQRRDKRGGGRSCLLS